MPDFTKMTKAQIGKHGTTLSLHLDERMTKAAMIAALNAHLETTKAPEAAPAEAPNGLIQVTILRSPDDPVRVAVNGIWWSARIGQPALLPVAVVAALENAGVEMEKN